MASIEQLIDRVRQKTMVGSSEIADAGMILWFNDAQDELANRYDWPWLVGTEDITTVATQGNYTLSADLVSIIAIVQDGERKRLLPVEFTSVIARYGDSLPTAADAKYYYLWNGDIYLLPVPDTSSVTYHVHMEGLATTFTLTTDVPGFLASFHYVLADFVEARVWEREEEFEKAGQAALRFELGVRQMRLQYQSQYTRMPYAIGDGLPAEFRGNDPFAEDWGIAG